jgi:DNA adenine methylase
MGSSYQRPILRWAGSKRKLLPKLISLSPTRMEKYVEPFVGSAALFFALQPRRAFLSDFNPELIDTYKTLTTKAVLVSRRLSRMPIAQDYYYQLRAKNPTMMSNLDRAARFIYLNRFCFNGVYRTNRQGQFNVPRGVRTGAIPTLQELKNAGKLLASANLRCSDFEECLAEVRRGDFVYLDPPYTRAGGRFSGEYGYGAFTSTDLDRLYASLKLIDQRGALFLFSYRYSRAVKHACRAWNTKTVRVRRHVGGFRGTRKLVREVLVSNYKAND